MVSTYHYEGRCPCTGEWLRLPRTPEVEAIARELMAVLQKDAAFSAEGKMYGVLLTQTSAGETLVLRAFSGLLQGVAELSGWVSPIPGRAQVAWVEARTLAQLADIKAELMTLGALPERAQLLALQAHYGQQLADLAHGHRQRTRDRAQHRQQAQATLGRDALTTVLEELDRQSQQDGMARRRLKRDRDTAISPLQTAVTQADECIQTLKRQRRDLSCHLQRHMHGIYRLTNFAGDSTVLQTLAPSGLPTGTGDCAAPKLLHAAASQGLHPIALAEFWWGPPQGDKQPGQFYGACRDRCQPIMGFLLSGLASPDTQRGFVPQDAPVPDRADFDPLTPLYSDPHIIAITKPSGLLSVPGRTAERQDSVLSRLRCQLPPGEELFPVHRLDQDTSGVLLLARSRQVLIALQAQFQHRQVHKRYCALLRGQLMGPLNCDGQRPVEDHRGMLDLPLWANPATRPRQQVCWQRGKPSLTHYRILAVNRTATLVEFQPITGRTHQLRVHAAHPQGLNAPIVGDRLYGGSSRGDGNENHNGSEDRNGDRGETADRLHLHATHLTFTHPITGKPLELVSPSPFPSPNLQQGGF